MTHANVVTDPLPCPFCGEPLHIGKGFNPYGRCESEGCWMHDRKMSVPLDDPTQVGAWNIRARHDNPLRLAVEKLRGASSRATPGPWRKFTSRYGNDTVAIMQGDPPAYDDNGDRPKRWKEIIGWQGFDGSDTSETRRHADARFLAACVNLVRDALAGKVC